MSRPYSVGLICARGGSKGLPRKNLRPLGGKPLIGWAVDIALKCPSLDRVVVSTDDIEIADVAREFGAEVPFMRPAELARDDSAELLAWQHCLVTLAELDGKAPEVLVNIPCTSPLRAVEDVEACVAARQESGADLCLTVKASGCNPYFSMVTLEDGWARIAMPLPRTVYRRQDAPEVFDVVPVAYAARAEYVMETRGLLIGKVRAIIVPAERALDIDTELDFSFVEFILERSRTQGPS